MRGKAFVNCYCKLDEFEKCLAYVECVPLVSSINSFSGVRTGEAVLEGVS